jgi:hypothetical protein
MNALKSSQAVGHITVGLNANVAETSYFVIIMAGVVGECC